MPLWMEPDHPQRHRHGHPQRPVLNLLFNILGGAERAAHNDACHQH
jgi:NCS2 family nucleobase:cation symporter-2